MHPLWVCSLRIKYASLFSGSLLPLSHPSRTAPYLPAVHNHDVQSLDIPAARRAGPTKYHGGQVTLVNAAFQIQVIKRSLVSLQVADRKLRTSDAGHDCMLLITSDGCCSFMAKGPDQKCSSGLCFTSDLLQRNAYLSYHGLWYMHTCPLLELRVCLSSLGLLRNVLHGYPDKHEVAHGDDMAICESF
eukprot:1147250-Pelagomonas_calceolata.AAC.5